ncbi:MAG: GNAT family N-acetyltransferase [Tannerella sp.]|jgi:hypothetical protein|nr:GNAT family N-acetyltransferase [Tannerella sp.]
MSKEIYRLLCRTEESIPVFSQDWWLDIVCGSSNWDIMLMEQNSRIQAAWPVYRPCSRIISMPPYTQTMGIWFAPVPEDTKYASALEHRQTICKQFIERLKPYKSFLQNFHHSFTDWLPFYWQNFRQTTRYTYKLNDLRNTALLLANMSRNMRRNLKKAGKQFHITVKKGISTDEFLMIQAQTFERQGIRNKQSREILQNLIAVCRERQQGDLWGGYDPEGKLHAAALIVWNKNTAYYLAGGGNPSLRSSGAHSLVLWEAIQYVSGYAESFDFEGSMLPGVERFFREFGATQTPYFTISKGKLRLLDKVMIKLNGR